LDRLEKRKAAEGQQRQRWINTFRNTFLSFHKLGVVFIYKGIPQHALWKSAIVGISPVGVHHSATKEKIGERFRRNEEFPLM
jgi:hypothetical protein